MILNLYGNAEFFKPTFIWQNLRLWRTLQTPALVNTAKLNAVLICSSAHSGSASSILTQTPPFAYVVMSDLTQTFSTDLLPWPNAHAAGGLASGFASMFNDIPLNVWRRRAIITDVSLYANCCPKQIRGPALNGRKMKGLGTRYLLTRSSKNRSGSNSSAVQGWSY